MVRGVSSTPVREVSIGQPRLHPGVTENSAMQLVGARLEEQVEGSPSRASHLGVIGVDLKFDLLYGFDRRDDHGAMRRVRDRNAIEQIIIAGNRSARDRDRSRARLIFHT